MQLQLILSSHSTERHLTQPPGIHFGSTGSFGVYRGIDVHVNPYDGLYVNILYIYMYIYILSLQGCVRLRGRGVAEGGQQPPDSFHPPTILSRSIHKEPESTVFVEANILAVHTEALTADIHSILTDETSLVGAHTALARTLSVFLWMGVPDGFVTHFILFPSSLATAADALTTGQSWIALHNQQKSMISTPCTIFLFALLRREETTVRFNQSFGPNPHPPSSLHGSNPLK